MKKVSYDEDMFYIEKYDIRHVYNITYLREDLTKPASFENRAKFNGYDAWKKIFECYNAQADIINNKEKIMEETKQISEKKEEKLSKQIDLLDMIAEVEQEIKNTKS